MARAVRRPFVVGLVAAVLGAVATAPAAQAVEGAPATGAAVAATVRVEVGLTHACSGALLNASWVVTAAACFDDGSEAALEDGAPPRTTKVTVGRDAEGAGGTTVKVDRLVVHPERDVVLARLESPVAVGTPVAVASRAPVAGEELTVVGYGRTSTLLVPDAAHAAIFTVERVDDGTLDIATDEDGATICKGDAGGPSLRATEDGGVELVAIHHTAYQGGCLGQSTTAQGATETRVDDLRQWIGWNTPTTQKTPVGTIDAVTPDRNTVIVSGWAWDPDQSAPIDVHVYVDGVKAGSVRADVDRPDVAAAMGTAATRGFAWTGEVADGNHSVCVYGIDVGPGPNPLLGCRDFSIHTRTPVGAIDAVSYDTGTVTVSGWAWDPDSPSPTDVHVYVDGVGAAAVRADLDRPDVARVYGTAPTRGYAHTLSVAPGNHTVCIYAINIGPGHNVLLGCREVSVDTRTPVGAVDAVTVSGGTVSISGWAWDPDTPSPTDVHVYIDGVGVAAVRADLHRPDVAQVYGTSPARGYAYSRAVAPGNHTACIYAINIGPGPNVLLGCRPFTT